MIRNKVVALTVLLFLVGSCALRVPTDTRRKFIETNLKVLQIASEVYERTLFEVGQAQARGLVTEQQVELVIWAAQRAKDSIEAARDALLLYIAATLPSEKQKKEVESKIDVTQRTIVDFQDYVYKMGRLQ